MPSYSATLVLINALGRRQAHKLLSIQTNKSSLLGVPRKKRMNNWSSVVLEFSHRRHYDIRARLEIPLQVYVSYKFGRYTVCQLLLLSWSTSEERGHFYNKENIVEMVQSTKPVTSLDVIHVPPFAVILVHF